MFDSAIPLDELDARGVCELVADARTRQLRADADIAAAVAHWCDLHACGNCSDGQLLNPHLPGSERAKVFGAEDNPEVLEFCVADLAVALRQHVNGAVELVADVQDLRFRHPLLWARVQGLTVPMWKARKIVGRTRHLPRELAQLVDARIADVVATLAWGRFLKILDAAVIAADPQTAERLRRAAEQARFAGMGRPDEHGHGMRTFTARTKGSDVVWFDAMCGRVAEMFKALGDTDRAEVRRAKAFALLAHPVKVIALFAEYQQAVAEGRIPDTTDAADPTDPTTDPATDPSDPSSGAAADELDLFGPPAAGAEESVVTESDVHPADNDADDPDVPCPACAGAGSLEPRVAGDPTPFVRLATNLHLLDWAKLLPKVTFYVHGTAADFRNPDTRPGAGAACGGSGGSGVVRVEGHGALTVPQARDFFGHDSHQISVRPVIDTTDVRAVDAYEAPDWMAEIVHLLSPGDIFPYAGHVGRAVDLDHLWRYLDPGSGGPPGQTHPDNLGPLVRFHHRIKTQGRWRMRVVRPRVCIWRTAHGLYFQTDPRGTHPLTDEAGQLLWDACAHHPETSGTGKVRAEDIPRISADAAVVPPDTTPPTPTPSRADRVPSPTRASPSPGRADLIPTQRRAGPSPIELEFFTIIERYEYELAPE